MSAGSSIPFISSIPSLSLLPPHHWLLWYSLWLLIKRIWTKDDDAAMFMTPTGELVPVYPVGIYLYLFFGNTIRKKVSIIGWLPTMVSIMFYNVYDNSHHYIHQRFFNYLGFKISHQEMDIYLQYCEGYGLQLLTCVFEQH